MKPTEDYALKSLRQLAQTGSAGFITSESCGPEKRYQVVAKFNTLEEMQAFYRSLINCGRAVREMDEPEENRLTDDHVGSVGPFRHDAGGGKRNVRSTNSLS